MFCSCSLFTNNPLIRQKVKAEHSLKDVEGTSLDVLFAARNAVHLGAKLLIHPLYGNLRPYQQPYRTILLKDDKDRCDFESLSLIENAIDVYQSCSSRLIKPEDLSEELCRDYRFVDFELLRESFVRYKILREGGE